MLSHPKRYQANLPCFSLSFCLALLISLCPDIAEAKTPKLILSEIQCADGDNKFIELFNASGHCVPAEETKKYQLKKITATGTSPDSIAVFPAIDIPKESHLLWVKNNDSLYAGLADFHTGTTIANNTSIGLFYDGSRIDSIVCGKEKDAFNNSPSPFPYDIAKGTSLLRNPTTLLWTLSPHPDPEKRSSGSCPKPEPSPISTTSLRINEVFPNPTDEDDEWIELFNAGKALLPLAGWILSDKTKSYPFGGDDHIAPEAFFLIPRTKSGIALNNTSETITLSDPSKNIVSEVSYQKTIESASLNYTPTGYRWSRTITPDAENILNVTPDTRKKDIPDTAYRGVMTAFSASGKDADGDTLKYTWDFGDGHKSYKKETMHRYEKNGEYAGTLAITDGTESNVTAFTVDVEKYEAPKVRMTALLPNPAGRDTDTEYITIENRSKKSVDLLGWSIATGWKKLVNHPIRESFVIPKKSERNLTHVFSAFTLPNEKGRIELRSPDGETVQKLKYNLKGKSAEKNALLAKEKGKKWEWILNQLTGSDQQIASQATVVPFAGDASAARKQEPGIDPQEEQLEQDTETITLKKQRGEKMFSGEQDSADEMRRLIGFGTGIETPIAVLALVPRVAGASDEMLRPEQIETDDGFDFNAIINGWLSSE